MYLFTFIHILYKHIHTYIYTILFITVYIIDALPPIHPMLFHPGDMPEPDGTTTAVAASSIVPAGECACIVVRFFGM